MSEFYYLNTGKASDLSGKDRVIYRFLELIPGSLTWATLAGIVAVSWLLPIWATYFIIAFDLYWLIKTIYLSLHLRTNWKKMRHFLKLDWQERLENIKYDHIWQMVILPFYKEDLNVIAETMEALLAAKWDKSKMMVVLAYEEKAGEEAEKKAKIVKRKYKESFGRFLLSRHPADLPGEIPGKGSNIAYAAEQARRLLLDPSGIAYEDVLVSAFDIDTRVYPQYFLCLTWHYRTCEKPHRSSFQPIPIYNNNIWEAPAFSRVVAASGTFWQMIQQERPERLATFSSHSVSFKALHEIGYWQKNIVSEDSRIFWQAYLKFGGDYSVVPISYPVSMDANLAPTFLKTVKSVYKQQLRWTWGVENIPYSLFGFLKDKKMAIGKKMYWTFVQLEGFWSLATNPLIIFFLGWLPLFLGGREFNQTLLSYNLPIITKYLMNIAMAGLVMSVIISLSFLPPLPQGTKKRKYFFMVMQWLLIPFTIPMFGSVPGVHSQTRLLLGKYMGFWVTEKFRKIKTPILLSKPCPREPEMI
ncbi:glycosyltransferase family 2 protein [Candidatus Parcubacteria bacterium]|nr:MAG: glycosyltransferase family 2 protein [Candidatus Parcubacteria bacterium]